MASGSVGVLRRFRSLIQSWPVDSTRKGRDLGEYLRNVYSLKIKETVERNPAEAEQAVQCLERLSTNHYRKLYHRKQESSFAGDIVVKNPWLLSNENLKKMNAKKPTLWQRLTGRGEDS